VDHVFNHHEIAVFWGVVFDQPLVIQWQAKTAVTLQTAGLLVNDKLL
jgi:hypothetical protein